MTLSPGLLTGGSGLIEVGQRTVSKLKINYLKVEYKLVAINSRYIARGGFYNLNNSGIVHHSFYSASYS